MEKFLKAAKTIRNNWKKSVFGAIVLYYGGATAKERYEINILMRAACKEAVKYGNAMIEYDRNPTLITVVLNPVANKRKAKKDFEKYCEPILHLAGLQVDVVQTTSEGSAKEIVENLKGTEAIIVAGGDGTLSETITGLLRRNDNANQFPLGILPLGKTNSLANYLFPGGNGVEKVRQLITACMAIVKGNTMWQDAMKIEPIAQDEEAPSRPIYAMTSIDWGAFRDTEARSDKYWVYGPFREYMSYIFNGYKDSLTWTCKGVVKYTPPCAGCSNCMYKKQEIKRKWSFFVPSTQAAPETDRTKLVNPECSMVNELCFKTTELQIQPKAESILPALTVGLGRNQYSYTEFVSEGWRRIKGESKINEVIEARTIELWPESPKTEEVFEIDKEEFDVKPMKVTILPKIVKLFYEPKLQY
ncbi:acylglycerol kinase, mitochondrial [Colias croceus]|uniref:acylglycerol kinase, mitochondrial n=1 Tax=Colias crocea TaxID=72248 RepID=UPI001E27D3F4|nr:acylglycerol kinase, mitochondrial [Colias croceus]